MMTDKYDSELLCAGIERFPHCRILVVGDVIVDEFVWGRVERISPEAPVPVVEVDRESLMLGGAGNVINNIVSLGGQTTLCGVIGDDAMGRELVRMLQEIGTPTHGLVVEEHRPTTIKTRVVAHSQQVVRVDREERSPVGGSSIDKILRTIGEELDSIQAILIADYGKGVVSKELMDGIRSLAAESQVMVGVDPNVRNLELYRDVTVVTPNNAEAQVMSGVAIDDVESLERAGNQLLKKIGCQMVLITRGEEGMTLFETSGRMTQIPTVARKVFDVSGAGDTVISTLTLALTAGLHPGEAAALANIAAGIVVAEVGTATVSASRLKDTLLNGLPGRGSEN
jgi:D-beta-D-heptose 7-phosphate kinase/D-beta-D-heptose 1-phosphate adenosyltransferase